MKTFLLPFAAALTLGLGTSCTTMYDAQGRPVDVITPEGAALAAVAAGVVGYAIGDNQNSSKRYYGGHGYGYNRGGYGGGGYGGYGGYGHGYGHGYGGGYCR